jgi:hypothetical protein
MPLKAKPPATVKPVTDGAVTAGPFGRPGTDSYPLGLTRFGLLRDVAYRARAEAVKYLCDEHFAADFEWNMFRTRPGALVIRPGEE